MFSLQDIKLIIWDLDETFWNGTISEGGGEVLKNENIIKFLQDTLDMGIMHSICSKNDFTVVKNKMLSWGIWDCFVFPSIDWSAKGKRVASIINTMKLRPVNVLFIDDNHQNLEEAKYFCIGIKTLTPDKIEKLMLEASISEHKDLQHKRLKQYHQMEKKEALRSEYSSNEDFLMDCNIKVAVCYDCETEIDRIHELVIRSNQLNYTKHRQSKEELQILVQDKDVKSGYVTVSDKFGEYGIVGFFAIKNGKAIHFVFSCRTLGMRIEQYIYSMLNYPEIEIVGNVVAPLTYESKPKWINQNNSVEKDSSNFEKPKCKVLFKGPCDMSQMYAFFNENTSVTEFSYTNELGILVEGHNHTSQIVTALTVNDERKSQILNDVSFFDKNMLDTVLKTNKFDFVVLSMLTDGNLGIYKRKSTGEEISLCEKNYSLTDQNNFEKYIGNQIFTSGIKFTKDSLENFSSKYDYVENCKGNITVKNLEVISKILGEKTKLVLLLGSEQEIKKPCADSFKNRHIEHKQLNDAIRLWAKDKNNVILITYDKYIKSDSDFIDTINHFSKKVYYELAVDLSKIFMSSNTTDLKVRGKYYLFLSSLKQRLSILKKALQNVM